MTPPPLSFAVLAIMASVSAAGLTFALYEQRLPNTRWITVLLCLYILPQWVWVDIAYVEMNSWVYFHTCHEYACRGDTGPWHVPLGDLGVIGIEIAALTVVSVLALARFRYLRWRYNW